MRLLLALSLVVLVALGASAAPAKYPRQHGAMKTAPADPEYLAIKDANTWARFRIRVKDRTKLPKVDFRHSMVILLVSNREQWVLDPERYGDGYMVALKQGARTGGFYDLVVVPRVKGGAEFNLR